MIPLNGPVTVVINLVNNPSHIKGAGFAAYDNTQCAIYSHTNQEETMIFNKYKEVKYIIHITQLLLPNAGRTAETA